MKVETDTLLILLKLKKELDSGRYIHCNWSATSRNPETASFTYRNFTNDIIIRAHITKFDILGLPLITFDDIIDLSVYIKNNNKEIEKIEKMAAFI